MKCPGCSSTIDDATTFCPYCGKRISTDVNYKPDTNTNRYHLQNIPSQYAPISAWGYVGYTFLFGIPLIGFILLIVFALSNENINRRNFARSYFCIILLVVIIYIIFGAAILGLFRQILNN